MWQQIKMILAIIRTAYAAIQVTDAKVSKRFSDEWAQEFRWTLEKLLVAAWKRKDKGILAFFESDNAFLRAMTIILKSEAILEFERAKEGTSSMWMAEKHLDSKDPQRTLRDLGLVPNPKDGSLQL